jgi:hypothetical protein
MTTDLLIAMLTFGLTFTTILLVFLIATLRFHIGAPKGKFQVKGFKDGELKFADVYKNEYIVLTPGVKFDHIEITKVG